MSINATPVKAVKILKMVFKIISSSGNLNPCSKISGNFPSWSISGGMNPFIAENIMAIAAPTPMKNRTR